MQRSLGSSRITSIREQDLTGIDRLLQGATSEAIGAIDWLRPHFVDADGVLLGLVQAFVLEHGGHLIVIDTCVGNGKDVPVVPDWTGLQTDFLERFRSAGFEPADVDVVLCTHLHLDHVGWNTYHDGECWQPTFPNARYLFNRAEYEFWQGEASDTYVPSQGEREQLIAVRQMFAETQVNVQRESVQPIVDAGLAEFVEAPCELFPGLRLIPTPGHTPGHVSVEISSDGSRALVTGDSFHHPCQLARPEWAAIPDSDQTQSTATRRGVLAEVAGTDVLVIGTHFAEPVCGHVVADGDSYRLVTDAS
jgi:glyoxylase-like metal-dependent hydrolase (beta-lactamase superfamily II)